MATNICNWISAIILAMGLVTSSAGAAGLALDKFLVIPDPAEPGSVTCGIQEALDRLPAEGGRVQVPPGIYVVQGTIFLKPNTMLTGAGRATVIRKDPAWIQYLAEDVKKAAGQDYVVVKDASALKPGMWVMVEDLKASNGDAIIERIDGNRVYLKMFDYRWRFDQFRTAPAWKPEADNLVSRRAAIFNGFRVVLMSGNCVLSDLSVDGNKRAQSVNGECLYTNYPTWWNCLRCVPYISKNCIVERCRIFDAAGVCMSVGSSMATIRDCEISGGYQGIHPGAGPYVRIVGNQIHGNEAHGIGACLGNYGMVISQNIVYENGDAGIGWFGMQPERNVARCGDVFNIISDNVVFRNGRAGIGSDQGDHGPYDFVITGNVVKDNWQRGCPIPQGHRVPAGICLFNAKRCVVTGNRCFDEQNSYGAKLAADVAAGAVELPLVKDEPYWFYSLPMVCDITGAWQDFSVVIAEGDSALVERSTERPGEPGRCLKLKKGLAQSFAKGAEVRAEPTQLWGIYSGGPVSEGNLIADNQCEGNRAGGILWEGPRTLVTGNVGQVSALADIRPLQLIQNGNFTNSLAGWKLSSNSAHVVTNAGASCLEIAADGKQALNIAPLDHIVLKPDMEYRYGARVKAQFNGSRTGSALGIYVNEVADEKHMRVRSGAGLAAGALTNGVWKEVWSKFTTPFGAPAKVRLWMQVGAGVAGKIWLDGVFLEEVPAGVPADRYQGEKADATPKPTTDITIEKDL